MAKDEREAFEKVLQPNLICGFELIKFAETRNAAPLTFCSFWVPTYLRDLAREVAVNARIAERKFRLFHWGARICCLAILALAVPGLWHLLRWLVGA